MAEDQHVVLHSKMQADRGSGFQTALSSGGQPAKLRYGGAHHSRFPISIRRIQWMGHVSLSGLFFFYSSHSYF